MIKELGFGRIEFEEYLIICSFNKDSKIEEKHAIEVTAGVKSFVDENDGKYGLIVDISEIMFISSAARKHFAKRRNEKVAAVAIVLKNQFQTSFYNLYQQFAKPIIPTRSFNKIENAKEWLTAEILK